LPLETRRAHFQNKQHHLPYTAEEMNQEILNAAKMKSSIPFTCFKKVVVYHVCHEKCKASTKDRIGNRFMFPYLGRLYPIHEKIIRRFRKVIQNCVSPPISTTTTSSSTATSSQQQQQITLISRQKWRIEYGLARAVPEMNSTISTLLASLLLSSTAEKQKQQQLLNYNLQVISQHEHSPNEFFKLLLNTDVFIGSMGASLSFLWLMKPKSVVVEIVGTSACSLGKVGWNIVPKCDFGGFAQASGISHLVLNLPRSVSVPKKLPTPGIYPGTEVYKKLIQLAICKKLDLMFGNSNINNNDPFCVSNSNIHPEELNPVRFDWKFATWKEGVDS